MGVLYRSRQFWRAIFLKADRHALEKAEDKLTPAQWSLFTQLQPAEKSHAVNMFCMLLEQGDSQPDLLVAALLHDVGKLRYRLNPIERAAVVLVKAIYPKLAHHWGEQPAGNWDGLPGWRKAFILAEQHPQWGAEMACQAGVSHLAETLIRQHERPHSLEAGEPANSMLHKLWLVDNQT